MSTFLLAYTFLIVSLFDRNIRFVMQRHNFQCLNARRREGFHYNRAASSTLQKERLIISFISKNYK